jgi:hypothetical protein
VSACVVTEFVLKIVALTEFLAQPVATGTIRGFGDPCSIGVEQDEHAVSAIAKRYEMCLFPISIQSFCGPPCIFFSIREANLGNILTSAAESESIMLGPAASTSSMMAFGVAAIRQAVVTGGLLWASMTYPRLSFGKVCKSGHKFCCPAVHSLSFHHRPLFACICCKLYIP